MKPRRAPSSHLHPLLAGLLLGLLACAPKDHRPPNVLLILVDDLGYGDLGAYGRENAGTANIDRLAAEGARFTRHYADSSCAPSRAALLTGRYPARDGFRPRGRGLRDEGTTLPELLRDRGYHTHHLGKWHLGGTGIWGLDSSPASALPTNHGFAHWLGFLDSLLLAGPLPDSLSTRFPQFRYGIGRYERPWLLGSHTPAAYFEGHLTDLLTDRAVEFMRTGGQRPWFLNLWYLAPHAPLEPHDRYLEGLEPKPRVLYRALVRQLDESVGRLLTALADSGQDRDTIVVLLSDNGGAAESDPVSNAPLEGKKLQFNEGDTRTPLLIRWPQRIDPGQVIETPVSILDLFPTIAAMVGAPPPESDGRDLSPLFDGDRIPQRPFFWEQSRPDGPYYSVLSAEGRFRLSRWKGEPKLVDLAADPNGGAEVGAQHPEEIARLEALYQRWRREVAQLAVRLSVDENGHGRVTGDDLQRAPGFGGFTFGIGVTPALRERPERDEVIARQGDLWELVRNPREALRVRIDGVELQGRKLEPQVCHAVVVTGHFDVSIWNPEASGGSLALYLDGVLQDSEEATPIPLPADLAAPTLLGLAAEDRDAFRGRLGTPILLNIPVKPDDGTGVSAAELGPELCPTAQR